LSSCLLRESWQTIKDLLLGSSLASLGSHFGSNRCLSDLVGPRNSLLDLETGTGVALRARETGFLHGGLGVLGVLSLLGSLLGLALPLSGGNSCLADGVVDFLVHGLKISSGFELGLDVAGELSAVLVIAVTVTLSLIHVGSDVHSKDVLPVDLRVVLAIHVASEAVVGVGDVQATIDSSLKNTEYASTSSRAAKADVQNNFERILLAFRGFKVSAVGMVLHAIGFDDTLVNISHFEGGKGATSKEETGGISRGIVGDTNVLGQAVFGKLVSIRSAKHFVANKMRRNNLRSDVAVAEADDHAVLRSVVLVAVLDNEATTSIIVRLAITSPTVLHLKPLKIRPGLQHFNERHLSRVLIWWQMQ